MATSIKLKLGTPIRYMLAKNDLTDGGEGILIMDRITHTDRVLMLQVTDTERRFFFC